MCFLGNTISRDDYSHRPARPVPAKWRRSRALEPPTAPTPASPPPPSVSHATGPSGISSPARSSGSRRAVAKSASPRARAAPASPQGLRVFQRARARAAPRLELVELLCALGVAACTSRRTETCPAGGSRASRAAAARAPYRVVVVQRRANTRVGATGRAGEGGGAARAALSGRRCLARETDDAPAPCVGSPREARGRFRGPKASGAPGRIRAGAWGDIFFRLRTRAEPPIASARSAAASRERRRGNPPDAPQPGIRRSGIRASPPTRRPSRPSAVPNARWRSRTPRTPPARTPTTPPGPDRTALPQHTDGASSTPPPAAAAAAGDEPRARRLETERISRSSPVVDVFDRVSLLVRSFVAARPRNATLRVAPRPAPPASSNPRGVFVTPSRPVQVAARRAPRAGRRALLSPRGATSGWGATPSRRCPARARRRARGVLRPSQGERAPPRRHRRERGTNATRFPQRSSRFLRLRRLPRRAPRRGPKVRSAAARLRGGSPRARGLSSWPRRPRFEKTRTPRTPPRRRGEPDRAGDGWARSRSAVPSPSAGAAAKSLFYVARRPCRP